MSKSFIKILAAIEIKLAKMLANLERPINIRYLRNNEAIQQPYPNNHLLFLLDENCEDAEVFLKQVRNLISFFFN